MNRTSDIERAVGEGQHFSGLQVLRGLAATLVVLYHAGGQAHERVLHQAGQGWFRFGAAGVDIFFPISGFIIYLSALTLRGRSHSWRIFMVRRVIRVAPLYWMVTAVKLIAVLIVPSLVLHATISLQHIFTSFLFIPDYDREGHALPLLQPGWTLCFEMMFYGVLTLLLAFGGPVIGPLVSVLAITGIIGFFTHGATISAPVDLLVSPLQLEFLGGVLVAHSIRQGYRIPPLPSVVLALASVTLLIVSNRWSVETEEPARALIWGLPGIFILFAFVSLEGYIAFSRWRLITLLGNASYAIYLIHTLVIPPIAAILFWFGLHNEWGAISVIVASVFAASSSGIVLHRFVELPLTAWLNRRLRAGAPKHATLNS